MTKPKGAPKCGAPTKQTGKPCRNAAGFKTDHPGIGTCHLHLGNSPSHVRNAQEIQARAAVVTYGRPIITTGIDALLDELYWTTGHAAYLRDRVQALSPEALVWGETRRTDDATLGTKVTWEAGVAVVLKLYLEERKHKVDVAERCVRAGIDERKVHIEEQRVSLLVAGLQWLAAQLAVELKLSESKVAVLDRLVSDMLRNQIPRIEGETQ